MDIKAKLSTVVSKQFPEFVREDHQTFVQFLEAYYEYLSQQDNRNIESMRDIDDTLDDFVLNFKNELDIHGVYFTDPTLGPHYDTLDERFFLKKMKQVYTAKGTEQTYKLLFRLLFNKDAEIYYPSKSMLRVSDGKWHQDVSIFVNVTSGSASSLVGNNIQLTKIASTGAVKVINVFVNKVKYVRGDIYEIFYENVFNGKIEVGASVTFGSFVGTIIPTVSSYKIEYAGNNFKVGQLIEIKTSTGSGTIIKVCKVTNVDSNGGIKNIDIVKFGVGYLNDFYSTIQPEKYQFTTNDPSTITITQNSVQQFALPSNSNTDGNSDYGYISTPNYWIDYGDGAYAGEILQSFYTSTSATLDNNSQNAAVIKFNLGAVARYPGYYSINDGFISDNIFIQDSKYYQAYSYVLKVDEQLESFKSLVKSYLHPAGMALFSEYVMDDIIDLSASVQSLLNYARLSFSNNVTATDYFEKFMTKGFTDAVTPTDFQTRNFSKALADTLSSPTDEISNFNFSKALNDATVSPTDAISNFVSAKALVDTSIITEDISVKTDSKAYADSINITESTSLNVTLTPFDTDTFSVSDASEFNNILFNPYTEGGYFAGDYVGTPIYF